MSCGPVDPVGEDGSSGIVGIDALAHRYPPMTIAATATTNAETVAVAARNTRRTCGCAPAGLGPRASSVGVVGLFMSSGVIGWVRERRRSRGAERTRRPGEEAGQAVTIVWRPSPGVGERAHGPRLMGA